jgi:hypothetical protein
VPQRNCAPSIFRCDRHGTRQEYFSMSWGTA